MSRKQLFNLFIAPLAQERLRLFQLAGALLLLSLAQSGMLLVLGPFMKALFNLHGMAARVTLAELLSPQLASMLPALARWEVARSHLVTAVPLALLLAGLVRNYAVYLYQLHTAALSLFMAKTYRDRLFARILALPYGEICQRSPGEWMSYLMNDVLFLQTRFSDILNSMLRDSVVMLAALASLALIHWPTSLVMLALCPLVAMGMGRTGKRIAYFAERFQRELALIADFTLELRKRFYFMRAQRGEARELSRFRGVNNSYYAMIRKSLWVRATFAPFMEFLGFAAFAVITLLVGRKLMGTGFAGVNILVFFAALGLLLRPLRNIGEQVAKFQETKGSLRHSIHLFTGEGPSTLMAERGVPLRPYRGLQIASLMAAYPARQGSAGGHVGEQQTPGKVTVAEVALEPGKAIAIIGPSGAGKSTLLKVMGGLIRPQQWQASCSWPDLAASAAMVSQEPFLFDDKLYDNLIYGLEGGPLPTDLELKQALNLVNVEQEVAALEEGLGFRIRALGSNLSGGQVQRLVIARALLRQKSLLLLDEATSAVDEASERDITLRLIAACRSAGTTLVAVTHRLRWLEAFDEVWFMEDGLMQAKGSHQELLQRPRYREFCHADH